MLNETVEIDERNILIFKLHNRIRTVALVSFLSVFRKNRTIFLYFGRIALDCRALAADPPAWCEPVKFGEGRAAAVVYRQAGRSSLQAAELRPVCSSLHNHKSISVSSQVSSLLEIIENMKVISISRTCVKIQFNLPYVRYT